MTGPSGRIEGAAKWAAVIVLGSAGLLGVARSFVVDRVHSPSVQTLPASAVIRPNEARPASDDPRPSAPQSITTRIDINAATLAELDLLPGIGPAYAQRIIDDRNANGPFTSIDDLQRVRGIGPKTAAAIEPLVRFGDP